VIFLKKIKYTLFGLFLVLSFYLTDRVMIYIDNNNPIMKVIEEKEVDYNIKPVNAIIKDNTIIPGVNGKEVNKHKSLIKMEEFGAFNDIYLIYNTIKPDISLDKNKDKIIIKGNAQKRSISLILEENEILENYLNEKNIYYNIITNLNTNLSIKREYINGESDEKKFSDLNSLLNKNSLNKKICLINYSNYNSCLKKEYYLISNSLDSKDNYLDLIKKIDSGDIILIRNETSLDTLKLILSEIKKLDLSIVYLSDLISE